MNSSKEKLRLALLIDSWDVPSWVHRMLSLVLEAGNAEIALVLKNERPAKTASNVSLAYLIHRKVDKALGGAGEDPFARVSLRDLISQTEAISVKPVQTKFSDTLEDDVCQAVGKARIDVGIRLGFRILRGDILKAPRYGVWSYHHGDSQVNRGGPPGFWEVMEAWPVTGATLQILSEDLDAGLVLSRTFSTTDPTFVERNKRKLYWSAAPMLSRGLSRLHDLGGDDYFAEVEARNQALSFYSRRLYRPPTNPQMVQAVSKLVSRAAKSKWDSAWNESRWSLLYKFSKTGEMSTSLRSFKRLNPPDGREWADPFVVRRENIYYLFFEDMDLTKRKARISCLTHTKSDGWSLPVTVLERAYHLSYPFVFAHDGQFYMVPESAENKTIELYRASKFPHEWELVEVLVSDVLARDTTLLFHEGVWWMFTCVQEHREMSSWQELFLYHSESLTGGEWIAHPQNPIVSDARSARPAGGLFWKNGELYRPSQNCRGCYGYSVNLNRVGDLTKTHYSEELVTEIQPAWASNVKRVHTLNHEGGLTVVDALVSRPKLRRSSFRTPE